MISIIICHRNTNLLEQLKKNIYDTIGVEYELIIIDNSENKYSIFQAYNEGVKKSKFPILCFTHEDIYYHSKDWGLKAVTHFEDKQTGIIGVSGGTIQSHIPSSWWYNHYINAAAVNVIMTEKKNNASYLHYNNPGKIKLKASAVVVDGLWFCVRSSLFEQIKFDEDTFKGFHAYDIDISLQANNVSGVFVVFDILIEHLWKGTIEKNYYNELITLADKWSNKLPVTTDNHKEMQLSFYYWHTLRNFILHISGMGFSKQQIKSILDTYLFDLKKNFPSRWFQLYFNLSRVFGYAKVNSVFFRIEKLAGYCKLPGYLKIPVEQALRLQHLKEGAT